MTGILEMAAPWRSPVPDAAPVEGRDVRLSDRSSSRRWGLRGAQAAAWLQQAGIAIPETPNQAVVSAGLCTARLSAMEFALLAFSEDGARTLATIAERLAQAAPAGCYDLPRQDMSAWLSLVGPGVPALMAELCAVDLRPARFPDGSVAQTSVALQNAVVLRRDAGADYGLDILVDFAGAASLWRSIAAAVNGERGH